jgi:anti-sigma B factor antagonist
MSVTEQFVVVSPTGSAESVVRAAGEIDMATAPRFRQMLSDALCSHPRSLTVDMADVTFMDSTGLNVLAAALKQCRPWGTDLVLYAPSACVVRVIELTGLHKMLRIILDPTRGAQPADFLYAQPTDGRVDGTGGRDLSHGQC